jgi:hypothetical protein
MGTLASPLWGRGVKKLTMLVILGPAKDLSSSFLMPEQMLRCAQHDRFEISHTFGGAGVAVGKNLLKKQELYGIAT